MTLVSSMYTAANGLEADSEAMNVVSDNIANVNTVGFKAGQARFVDIMASEVANTTVGGSLGQGAMMSGVTQSFSQGAPLSTGGATDLAIGGDGFFVVGGSYQGMNGTYYTRAGQFAMDNTGTLVNPQGLAVQGYTANSAGVLNTNVGNLQLQPNLLIPPTPTANTTLAANLDATAVTPTAAFSPTSASTTSNYSTSVTMYDSLGVPHNIDVYFRNNGSGSYEWHALANGSEVTGGTAGTPSEIAGGVATFGTNGTLTSVTNTTASVNFVGATAGQSVAFDFGDPTASGGTGMQGVTSYAGNSTVSSNQDGSPQGSLVGVQVNSTGVVTGKFTNGVSRVMGQLIMAHFTANEGLDRIGGTLYGQTLASGQPSIGTPGGGGRGTINAGSLEQSNVNLSQEFINLLAYQRGFQANTRTVHASDEMLTELVNLAR